MIHVDGVNSIPPFSLRRLWNCQRQRTDALSVMPKKQKLNDELIRTRASLIDRLKNWEDHKSWREFFDTYWKLIYGVARHAGLTDAEAQDVVQETMLHVAKKMPKFNYDPAIGSFKAWLLNKVRWASIQQLRKRGRFEVQP